MKPTDKHLLDSYQGYAFAAPELVLGDLKGLLTDHRAGALVALLALIREEFVQATAGARDPMTGQYEAGGINGVQTVLMRLDAVMSPPEKEDSAV